MGEEARRLTWAGALHLALFALAVVGLVVSRARYGELWAPTLRVVALALVAYTGAAALYFGPGWFGATASKRQPTGPLVNLLVAIELSSFGGIAFLLISPPEGLSATQFWSGVVSCTVLATGSIVALIQLRRRFRKLLDAPPPGE